jgi:hypothetical protein
MCTGAKSASERAWDEVLKIIPVIVVIFLILLPFIPSVQELIKSHDIAAFWLIFTIYIVIIIGIGFKISGKNILGILIDRRNMVSLSKLQMVLWTILVVSGFVTIAALKGAYGIPNPLDIGIPETLWVLMGISTVSLIGSPLLKSDNLETEKKEVQARLPQAIKDWEEKQDPKKTATTEDKAKIKLGVEEEVRKELRPSLNDGKLDVVGSEIVNKYPCDASIWDIFRGEEVGNFKLPDLGKIQLILFTLIAWGAYAMLIYQVITGMNDHADKIKILVENCSSSTNQTLVEESLNGLHKLTDFPDISGGMTALIGISNAGYLAYKGIPREQPINKTN